MIAQKREQRLLKNCKPIAKSFRIVWIKQQIRDERELKKIFKIFNRNPVYTSHHLITSWIAIKIRFLAQWNPKMDTPLDHWPRPYILWQQPVKEPLPGSGIPISANASLTSDKVNSSQSGDQICGSSAPVLYQMQLHIVDRCCTSCSLVGMDRGLAICTGHMCPTSRAESLK